MPALQGRRRVEIKDTQPVPDGGQSSVSPWDEQQLPRGRFEPSVCRCLREDGRMDKVSLESQVPVDKYKLFFLVTAIIKSRIS